MALFDVSDSAINGVSQYGRAFSLIVYGLDVDANGNQKGDDLSALRCKFSVKRAAASIPNTAEITVYNLEEQTALRIREAFNPTPGTEAIILKPKGRVLMQGGYDSNFGVIFQGNIKQVIVGRESATDTFITIIAGDGDFAYNYAVVSKTLASGCTQSDQLDASIEAMTKKGVTKGYVGPIPDNKLPRGKVMYGNARNYLQSVSDNGDSEWSIQNEEVVIVGVKTFLPNEIVVITSKTGMIGTPQQTNQGINIKCLLNPLLQPSGRIKIDNRSVALEKIDQSNPKAPANIPPPISADGLYFMYVVEHTGDTRGVEWYSNLVCLVIDPTTNPLNAVQTNYS